jgi:hypothetical protein
MQRSSFAHPIKIVPLREDSLHHGRRRPTNMHLEPPLPQVVPDVALEGRGPKMVVRQTGSLHSRLFLVLHLADLDAHNQVRRR